MNKLLTIVINIANDNYYDDLIYRTQKALDLNLFYLNSIKCHQFVEFIFVDWGSKKKLSDIILVNKKFKKLVKFIYVNEKISKKYSRYFPNNFNYEKSYNVGIRRSKGKYVLQTGCDQFFSPISWLNLINHLQTNTYEDNLILVPRKIIEIDLYLSNPSETYLNLLFRELNSPIYKFKPFTFYSGGGFSALLSRKNFYKLKGYNEGFKPGTSNDNDLFLRTDLLNINKINTDTFGVFMYKFPPLKNSLRNKLIYSKNTRIAPDIPNQYNVNSSYWGLSNYKLESCFSNNLSTNYDNYNKFKKLLPYPSLKFNRYKALLKIKDFYIKDYSSLKDILLLINIIKKEKILNFVEFGFKNSFITNLVGNYFKYLTIYNFDYNSGNNNYKFNQRLNKIIESFNKFRYGAYYKVVNKSNQYFQNLLDQKINNKVNNLLLINYNNNKNCNKFIKKYIIERNKIKLFEVIIILNLSKEKSLSLKSFLKSGYKIIRLNNQNILLMNKKNKNNYKDFDYSNLNGMFPFIASIIHKSLSKLYNFLLSFFYSFIK